jgi:hypothetical protein
MRLVTGGGWGKKTDRLDAVTLVMMLVRVCSGEPGVWQEVRVPSEAQEAARHVSRERTAVTQEQTRLSIQIDAGSPRGAAR